MGGNPYAVIFCLYVNIFHCEKAIYLTLYNLYHIILGALMCNSRLSVFANYATQLGSSEGDYILYGIN